MTMLDRMRRHRNWLKWSLAIVVVSFVLLYIPSFLKDDGAQGAAGNPVVADVEGREITATQFRRVYQQQMNAYRQSYGANVDDKLKTGSPEVRRVLGGDGGYGRALGLDAGWAYSVIKQVGNYAEIWDRNLGAGSPIKAERRLNRLYTDGGLMFPLPWEL